MAEESLSPADMMALMNNGNGMNGGMWNNPFMYLIWLAIFGNGGFGNWGNRGATAEAASIDRAALADGLNNQTVLNDLRNIETGIANVGSITQTTGADLSQQMCGSFGTSNLNISNGFSGVNNAILGTSNNIINAINTAAANQQVANCNLSHAIQDNKYEMAQNTCAITNAVHQEGELTRKSLAEQQIQELRDSREAVQRELQSAQLALANSAQTQNLLSSMGRFVPYSGCGSNCGGGF